MKKCAELLYDYAAGYALLCWICERPVFARPPRFTWLINTFIADSDELEQYLASRRLKYNKNRLGRDVDANKPAPRKERFSDIVDFNRSRDVKRK